MPLLLNAALTTSSDLPLGLNFTVLAAHIVNIVVLFLALRFLLYKPVRKFLDEREQRYSQRIEDMDLREGEIAADRTKYDQLLKEAHSEADQIITTSRAHAHERAEEIVEEARQQSKQMMERTRREIADERKNARIAMREEVADLAVNIAGRVLEREVDLDDNQHIVDKFLSKERLG